MSWPDPRQVRRRHEVSPRRRGAVSSWSLHDLWISPQRQVTMLFSWRLPYSPPRLRASRQDRQLAILHESDDQAEEQDHPTRKEIQKLWKLQPHCAVPHLLHADVISGPDRDKNALPLPYEHGTVNKSPNVTQANFYLFPRLKRGL